MLILTFFPLIKLGYRFSFASSLKIGSGQDPLRVYTERFGSTPSCREELYKVVFLVTCTSPIVITVPTKGLLAVETMHAIVQWQKKYDVNVCKQETSLLIVNASLLKATFDSNFDEQVAKFSAVLTHSGFEFL